MHAGGPPAIDTVASWMLNLLDPIRFVHALDPPIVHRDLKPANILVERQKDGQFRLRVADFGISDVAARQALRDTGGQSRMTIGVGGFTALYASPQQINNDLADPRDDVHALGVIWLQMLTGDLNKGRPAGSGWKVPLRTRGMSEPMLELLELCVDDVATVRPRDAGALAAKLTALLSVGRGGTQKAAGEPPIATSADAKPAGSGVTLAEELRRERQRAEQANTKARKALDEQRYAEAQETLTPIAAHLQAPGLFKTASENASEVSRLDTEIPVLARSGRYREARAAIKQLLGLQRWRDDMRQLLDELKEPELAREIVNSVNMKLMLIPEGTFLMGSPDGVGSANEHPQHPVEITRPFYLGAVPVTQAQYQYVMGKNPSWFCATGSGKDNVKGVETRHFPVEQVSWEEAVAFCERLSNLPEEKKAGRVYRLPTEAQWEYACRGGATSHSLFHFGATLSPKQANFDQSGLGRTCPVGSFPANTFGLYDMHGNVWEWCADWYDENYYHNSPKKDPQGPEKPECRVLRGGSWSLNVDYCRSAYRYGREPGNRRSNIGFRVCLLLDL